MENMESRPIIRRPERGPRLVMEDRGPWIFALYWYSFRFHMRNEPPMRAMSFFGLSSALRSILLENERTATLARRFDLRSRVLMGVCFIPGLVCLAACLILCGLPQPMTLNLRDHFPTLGAMLLGLSFLTLALMAVFTRDLYRSFKALFDAYNASEPVEEDAPRMESAPDRAEQSAPSKPADPAANS
jgi:hypothetical protein